MLTHKPFPRFSGLVNTRSELDSAPGTMRRLSNAVPSPPGAISSAMAWDPIYHPLSKSGGIVRIVDGPLRIYISSTPTEGFIDMKILTKYSEANVAPSELWGSAHLDGYPSDLPAYLSAVGPHIFVGNGRDSNAVYLQGEGPLIRPLNYNGGRYAKNKHEIPPCKTFVRGPQSELYCTGNIYEPLRIWVTEPINVNNAESFGLASETLSHVDIVCNGATRVTGLSVYRGSVICHTDDGAVVLEKIEKGQAASGWRVEQLNTDMTVGAYSLRTLNPSGGRLPYYLGADGQLYRNEFRTGVEGHMEPQAEKAGTWRAVGLWDETVKDLRYSFVAYNQAEHYAIVGTNADFQTQRKGHPYYLVKGRLYEGTRQEEPEVISGPHWFPRFTVMEAVPNSSHMVALDEAGNVWTTDLRQLRDETKPIPFATDLGPNGPQVAMMFDPAGDSNEATVITDDEGNILADSDQHQAITISPSFSISYEDRGTLTGHSYMFPNGERVDGMIAAEDAPEWSENKLLAVLETSFYDFGSPQSEKQIYEVILNFTNGSTGEVGVFVETDNEMVDGRWFGSIEEANSAKLGVLARGRKFKVRVYVMYELSAAWTLNDISVGYVPEVGL